VGGDFGPASPGVGTANKLAARKVVDRTDRMRLFFKKSPPFL
jgi:hypothetical protein